MEEEREVASYVLAYLLHHNYKNTASAFLKECQQLPSKSLIVLPERPLAAIISQHKAQQNAKVLVNTLGREKAWHELWDKLNTTLSQIRCVSEEFNSRKFQQPTKVKATKITSDPTHKMVAREHASTMSPHKRKQGPRRKILQSVSSPPAELNSGRITPPPCSSSSGTGPPRLAPASASGNSPTMQQVLDTFMDDATFPSKLADIINQCVTSDDNRNELAFNISTKTLDQILNVTLSEPSVEGVLPVTVVPNTSSMLPPTPPVTMTTPVTMATPISSSGNTMLSTPMCSSGATGTGGVVSMSGGVATRDYAGLMSDEVLDETSILGTTTNTSAAIATHVTYSSSLSPAMHGFQDVLTLAKKRPRVEAPPTTTPTSTLDYPTEQDIDSFLDQIHQ